MKKIYYVEYRRSNGDSLSSCESIFGLSEVIENILEREDVILDSIKVYTEEVEGNIHDRARELVRNHKMKNKG